ncbi:MAG: lysoplasmalogenase [Bacteroidales bacterium]|nr:lysoplasmalogenase [Bacteroidales bacterium]
MKKQAVWCIPCIFFVVACVLNLIGCVQGSALADTVKPALLPLLCATSLAYLLGRDIVDFRPVGLLAAAQLLGCTGDVLLIPEGFAFFASGIAAFLIGHLFYMALFGGLSWKGLTLWQWLVSLVVMAAVVLGLVKAIGVQGELFWPMLIYGFFLMLLIFSTLAGVLRMPRGNRRTWWILLLGALLFTFSDSCIAMGTFGVMTFPLRHFVVMITYLAAQSLLAVGGVRLILGR